MTRIEMPWSVKIYSPQSSSTNRMVRQYFATKPEAVAFAGDERRVAYRPGEAWKQADPEHHVQ